MIRELEEKEKDAAIELCREVFKAYEAPDYTEDGVKEFDRSIHNRGFKTNCMIRSKKVSLCQRCI